MQSSNGGTDEAFKHSHDRLLAHLASQQFVASAHALGPRGFLLGPWVAAARALAASDAEAAQNEWNLRTQARPGLKAVLSSSLVDRACVAVAEWSAVACLFWQCHASDLDGIYIPFLNLG